MPRAEAATRCSHAPASQGRTHPVIALWPVAIRDELRRAVAEQGVRKIDLFTQRGGCATAEWPATPVDPFFNVNTPEDLAEADRRRRALSGSLKFQSKPSYGR